MSGTGETDTEARQEPGQDLFKANLEIVRQIDAGLANTLETHVPASRLVQTPDGEWDIEFRGEYLYGENGRTRNENDLEALRQGGGFRFQVAPLSSCNLEFFSARVLYNILHRATGLGIAFNQRPTENRAYHAITFGMGLGYHLPALLEMCQPYTLCIIEPNIDFLYHSLSVYDWEPLGRMRRDYGYGSVTICTAASTDGMAQMVRSHCRGTCPVAVDGAVVFQSYANEQMKAAAAQVVRDAYLISIGLGFVHDEMEMTRAAHKNMRDADYKLFKAGKTILNAPVFIIGSGPSIDDDLETIKANQDKAVIVACGTAGRVLLANGIQPDFEVILENGTNPYLALSGAHEQFGFEKAVLIASNTVDPRLKSLFKNSVFFLRQAVSSYALYYMGPEYQINNPGPTVVNTGLSAAIAMGFRDFYLFGVDLGTRVKGRHHSRHSVYRHDDDDKEGVLGAFDYTDDYPMVDVGNFGGLVYTDLIMSWTRDAIVQALAAHGAVLQIHNCSDGLQIPNTVAMSSGSIRLKTKPEDKTKAIASALAAFGDVTREQAESLWKRENWAESIRTLVDQASAIVSENKDDQNAMMFKIKELLLVDSHRIPRHNEFFVRGTILLALMAVDYYTRRVDKKENVQTFIDICNEELLDMMNLVVQQVDWFFENLEDFESYEDLEEQARGWGNE